MGHTGPSVGKKKEVSKVCHLGWVALMVEILFPSRILRDHDWCGIAEKNRQDATCRLTGITWSL